MKNRIIQIAFFLVLPCCSYGAMTIEVVSVPQLTPLFDNIYIAGTFNDWNEADPAAMLQYDGNTWTVAIEGVENSTVEFKFTRGSWPMVEGNALGGYIENRTATFHNNTLVSLSIAGWEDIAGQHTITENVRIIDTDFAIPQLNRTRRIWITLPENYDNSNEHYPVLYFHDGQNVFDVATSFSGEWGVDETLLTSAIPGCNELIVVAIDNGGASRIDEYSPWVNAEYDEGGEGAAYANFIVETLKPVIDANFRTLPGRLHTSTAGSSLGALIAMYMLAEHNDVFSKAGILSPAFWFNPEIYDFVENNPPQPDTEIFFACGTSESSDMVSDMEQMYDVVVAAGVPQSNLVYSVQSGGTHSEYWWSQYFPIMFSSLYDCVNSVTEFSSEHEIRLFPNPADDSIHISLNKGLLTHVSILDEKGVVVMNDLVMTKKSIDISKLAPGVYTMRCSFKPENSGVAVTENVSFIKK